MHVAEQGTGPLVVLLHGFPELWYSWRHQITFFANQYSYSRSMLTSFKNLASLVLSTSTGLWTCKPNLFSQMFSSQEKQNQQSDLSYIYANWKDVNPLFCDRNWELLAAREGTKVTIAMKFIVGDKDIGFESNGTREYITRDVFKRYIPNLEVVILDGHHFIQQERAQEVSNEILSFASFQDIEQNHFSEANCFSHVNWYAFHSLFRFDYDNREVNSNVSASLSTSQ